MKKLLFALMLLAGVAYGQSPTNYTRIVGKYRWTSGMFDSMFYVPRYNGTPSSVRSGETSVIDGAVAVDTANSRFYIYSGGTWVRVGNYSEITGLAVDSVWRVAGKDSIFWRKNSVTYAIKDSSNVGTVTGTGTTNRLAKFTSSSVIGASQVRDSSNVLAYIASGGNAGIQIVSPAGSYYPALTWYSNGTSATSIYSYLTNSYYDAAGGIRLNGGGTGNVMVGTNTDGGQKLQVNGTSLFSGIAKFDVGAGTGHIIDMRVNNRSSDYWYGDGSSRLIFNGAGLGSDGVIYFGNGASANNGKSYDWNQGNFTNINEITLGSRATATFNPDLNVSGAKQGVYIYPTNDTYDEGVIQVTNAAQSSTRFIVKSGGNVGIGTGSPSYTLDVTGKIRGTDSAFFATSSGSVGIGTTSPDSLLTVNTGTHLQRGVRMSGIPKGAQTYSLYVNASGTIYKDTVINNYATTYTPTLTNTTNIDSSTAFTTYYKSDGDWVHVWGEVEIDPTAATTLTVLEMDIPIGGTFNVSRELAGTAATEDNSVALIKGSTLNSKAIFRLKPNHSTLSRYSFTFSYKIVNP